MDAVLDFLLLLGPLLLHLLDLIRQLFLQLLRFPALSLKLFHGFVEGIHILLFGQLIQLQLLNGIVHLLALPAKEISLSPQRFQGLLGLLQLPLGFPLPAAESGDLLVLFLEPFQKAFQLLLHFLGPAGIFRLQGFQPFLFPFAADLVFLDGDLFAFQRIQLSL